MSNKSYLQNYFIDASINTSFIVQNTYSHLLFIETEHLLFIDLFIYIVIILPNNSNYIS